MEDELTFLLGWVACSILLNSVIKFKLEGDPPVPTLDRIMTILTFYIFWPAGLIFFLIRWYQGRASIDGMKKDD